MLQLRMPVVFSRGWPATAAALLWAWASASAVFWWLHSPRQDLSPTRRVHEAPVGVGAVSSAAVARALGQVTVSSAAPDVQKRFQLLGVIAAGTGQGSALIAVDGQPPQAFVQGQTVTEGWQLQSLTANGLVLQGLAGQLRLALPD